MSRGEKAELMVALAIAIGLSALLLQMAGAFGPWKWGKW